MKRIGSTAERLSRKPYERRVCRIETYPPCLDVKGPRHGMGVEDYVDLMADAGVEVHVVSGQQDGCTRYASTFGPLLGDPGSDPLPRFIELAHARDILILSYISMTAYKSLLETEPGWFMEYLDEGRAPPEENFWCCINSPFRDWLPRSLIEMIDQLNVDGFFFDGTNFGSHADPGQTGYHIGCRCTHCRRVYADQTGRDVPDQVDIHDKEFRRYLAWRRENVRDFMVHVTHGVHAVHPDAILDFNHYAGVYNNWTLGHPANPLLPAGSGAYFFVERTVYDGSSLAAKYVRAHGTPAAVWIGPTQGLPECANHTAPYPEPFAPTADCMSIMANGARPILAMLPNPSPPYRDYMRAIWSNCRRRADYLEGDTLKYVAMHWSETSRDYFAPSPNHFEAAAGYFKRIRGTFEMLNRSHLLTDVVFDRQITDEHLAPYKILFLSNSACLSAEQCDVIRRFVDRCGTVIATYESALQDEWGERRENFQLADVFGVDYHGRDEREPKGGCVYVSAGVGMDPRIHCFAGRQTAVRIRADASPEILCTKCGLHVARPIDHYREDFEFGSGEPAITNNRYGNGSAIYITGDIGLAYSLTPYPPLRRLVAQLVKRTPSPIEIEAPGVIEVSAAIRPSGELMIHLVNSPVPFIGHSMSPDFHDMATRFFLNPQDLIPIHDVKVTFNQVTARSARLPLRDEELPIAGSPPSVTVPRVDCHEVVLVDS